MSIAVDINCDMGERPEALFNGSEDLLMSFISSANIACGGHAGNEESMKKVIQLAKRHGVSIGAHPGYPDKENFGRVTMNFTPEEISSCVYEQVGAIARIAREFKYELVHVKPHGALYNRAVNDVTVAAAIADGVRKVSPDLILTGMAGSRMLDVWRRSGFKVAGEAFADRVYDPDGSLRSRQYSDALIIDPGKAAEQAVQLVVDKIVAACDGSRLRIEAQTICIHSDTPGAVEIVQEVRKRLEGAGVQVRPMGAVA